MRFNFWVLIFIQLGLFTLVVIFAAYPAKDTIIITPELIGVANLVWKIPFASDDSDIDDILDSHKQPDPLNAEPGGQIGPALHHLTKEGFEKWQHANIHNNILCQRSLDVKVASYTACIYDQQPCSLKLPTVGDLWRYDVRESCTTSTMRDLEETLGKALTLTNVCHAQVHYLLTLMTNNGNPLLTIHELPIYMSQMYPISVLWTLPEGVAETIVRSAQSKNTTLEQKVVNICAGLHTENSIFFDDQERSLSLPVLDQSPFDSAIVQTLQGIATQMDHFPAAVEPPHKADYLVVISQSKMQNMVNNWANTEFDWLGTHGPSKKSEYIAESSDDVLNSLMEVIGGPTYNVPVKPKTLFLVEAVNNVDTVKKFMIRFLYTATLNEDHWIYFFPNPDSTFEEKILTAKYLTHLSLPDVHWVSNLGLRNISEASEIDGSVNRFYGLRRKAPKPSDWVVHVKDGTMKPADIPDHFDWRETKPECLYSVVSQGYCGSCWAVTAAEAINSAKCIVAQKERQFPISIQDILSCVEPDLYGCKGAFMSDALITARNTGFVSEKCLPYYNGNCNDLEAHGFSCSTEAKQGMSVTPTATCKTTCDDGKTVKSRRPLISNIYWLNSASYGRTRPKATAQIIQEYIMKIGPVIAGIAVYPDFEEYDAATQIYVHKHDPSQRLLGGHAILLVGWGTETNEKGMPVDYWVAKNSWGAGWGDDGYFRLVRGVGGIPYVEDEIYSLALNADVLY